MGSHLIVIYIHVHIFALPLYVYTSMDILLLIQKCLENHFKWDFCIYSLPTPFFLVFVWKTNLWYNTNLFPYELKTFSLSTYHSKTLSYQGTLINWDYIRPFLSVLFSMVILELSLSRGRRRMTKTRVN